MSSGQLKPDCAQVLQALRREVPVDLSAQQQAQLLSRIEASAGLVGAGATLGHANGTTSAQSMGNVNHVGLTDQLATHLAVRPLATLLSTLVLGGALGVAGHAAVTARHQRQIDAHVQRSAVPQAAPAMAPNAAEGPVVGIDTLPEIKPAPQVDAERLQTTQRAGAPLSKRVALAEVPIASADAPNLAEQLALLEAARGALQKSDATAALRALSSHAAQFPNSVLNEERDALTIKALVMANRHAEASSRMVKFEAAYPGSLLLPALRKNIGNFP